MSAAAEKGTERPYEGSELALFAHATHWKRYWASLVAPFVGARVLDVGAGLGATADALRGAPFARWTALEPDPALASHMREAVASGRLPDRIDVRCGTTADLRPEERFDTILYVDVLEHIEDDRAELARAADHLATEGVLIVLAPAHAWLYTPFDRAIGHCRRYSRSALRAVLPATLAVEQLRYLDSVGMLASLGNRLLLRSAHPTLGQITAWDRCMVPLSQRIDPWLRGRVGKSVLGIFRRRAGARPTDSV